MCPGNATWSFTREVGEAYAAWSEPFERLICPSSICVMESAKLKIRLSCVTTTTARSSETATVQLMLPLRGAYWMSRIRRQIAEASFGARGAEAEVPRGLGGRAR